MLNGRTTETRKRRSTECPSGPPKVHYTSISPVSGNNLSNSVNFKLINMENCGKQPFPDRIRSGSRAGIHEFPWLGLIKYHSTFDEKERFGCHGTLITSRYVLTGEKL